MGRVRCMAVQLHGDTFLDNSGTERFGTGEGELNFLGALAVRVLWTFERCGTEQR